MDDEGALSVVLIFLAGRWVGRRAGRRVGRRAGRRAGMEGRQDGREKAGGSMEALKKGQAVEQTRRGKRQKDMQVGRQKGKRQESWAGHFEAGQAGKNTYDKDRKIDGIG
jgi:hypothetical protein